MLDKSIWYFEWVVWINLICENCLQKNEVRVADPHVDAKGMFRTHPDRAQSPLALWHLARLRQERTGTLLFYKNLWFYDLVTKMVTRTKIVTSTIAAT